MCQEPSFRQPGYPLEVRRLCAPLTAGLPFSWRRGARTQPQHHTPVRRRVMCAMTQSTQEHQEGAELLRRLMCNELDQQICQMTQRSAEGVVDALCASVGHNLGGQTRQQPSQRLRTMTLQAEEVLELANHPSMIWRLPEAQRRSAFDHARLLVRR